MRRTFLLERSQWMMSFQWKGQGYVIAQIVLKVIGRGSFDCWVRDSSSNSISKTRRPNSGSQAIPRYCTILGVPYLTEKLTLLLKLLYDDLAVRIIELEEGRMKQFDRARKLVKHGLADIPIGPSALQCIQMNEPIYYSIESITIHHKPHMHTVAWSSNSSCSQVLENCILKARIGSAKFSRIYARDLPVVVRTVFTVLTAKLPDNERF